MEILAFIAVILAWIYGPKLIASLTRAGWRTATGKGSFSSNFEASFVGMSAMQMRLRPERIDSENNSFYVLRVEIKGLLPVERPTQLVMTASIFDVTDNGADGKPRLQPVLCFLEKFQEPESRCYQDMTPIGRVEPNTGFVEWQIVANIIPDTLTGPYSGNRRLKVFLICFDETRPPKIRHGFVDGSVLKSYAHAFEYQLKNTGYQEAVDNRRQAEEMTIQAAMHIGLADGSLATEEGVILKRWIASRLDMLDDKEREPRRQRLNAVLTQAFADGRAGRLDLGRILPEIARVGDAASKADAVELCLDVMSADGHADQRELQQVNRIAQQLGVDMERYHEMKDKRIGGLSASVTGAADYHALLGIDPKWDRDQVRSHLNQLYSRWNSRAESQKDPEKRAEAERMLETVAAARQALLN